MIRGKADVIMIEVHNKCNVLESSQNLPSHPQSVKKLSSMKLVPSAQWGLL